MPNTSINYEVINSAVTVNSTSESQGVMTGFGAVNWPCNFPDYWDSEKSAIAAHGDGIAGARNAGFWSGFDRYASVNLRADEMSGRHYIFIVRPDLYIFEDGTTTMSAISRVGLDPHFRNMAQTYPHILSNLSITNQFMASAMGSDGHDQYHAFMPFLSSRVESLQLPDFTLKTSTIIQPYSRMTTPFTRSGTESQTGGTFDLTFRDDGEYSIHKLFYTWLYYQDKVVRGEFRPKDRYIYGNAFDYATSVYDIIVDATGENIIHWSKYTGAVPTSCPMSNLSYNKGGSISDKITIPFTYFYHEHLNPWVLMDFNFNALGYGYMEGRNAMPDKESFKYSPNYEELYMSGANRVGRPCIILDREYTDIRRYKLKWLSLDH